MNHKSERLPLGSCISRRLPTCVQSHPVRNRGLTILLLACIISQFSFIFHGSFVSPKTTPKSLRATPRPPRIKISACLCLRQCRVTRSRTQHHKTFSEFPQIWLPSLFISFVLTLRTSDSRHTRSERAPSSPEQEFSMSFAAEVINGALSDILCPLDNRNLNTKTVSPPHRRALPQIDASRSKSRNDELGIKRRLLAALLTGQDFPAESDSISNLSDGRVQRSCKTWKYYARRQSAQKNGNYSNVVCLMRTQFIKIPRLSFCLFTKSSAVLRFRNPSPSWTQSEVAQRTRRWWKNGKPHRLDYS